MNQTTWAAFTDELQKIAAFNPQGFIEGGLRGAEKLIGRGASEVEAAQSVLRRPGVNRVLQRYPQHAKTIMQGIVPGRSSAATLSKKVEEGVHSFNRAGVTPAPVHFGGTAGATSSIRAAPSHSGLASMF